MREEKYSFESFNLKHARFATITSTQTYCVDNMQNIIKHIDEKDMYCVSSEVQTFGKGKYGSVWKSPKGNMYASYVMQMPEKVANVELVQRTAVASSVSLESFGVNCQIKWINDLLLNNKKIGGIICDCLELDQKNYLIVGIGINLANSPETSVSTSVVEETKIQIEPNELILKISQAIHKYIKCATYSQIIKEYRERLAYKNNNIEFSVNGVIDRGILLDFTDSGELQIQRTFVRLERTRKGPSDNEG